MPTWPPAPGRRTLTLDLDPQHIQHLDSEAAYLGCSRAAYLRQLVIKHRDCCSPVGTPRPAGTQKRVCAFELPESLIAYLDTLAASHSCSRAAVIRCIIAIDIRRQGPALA